ncbi:hypothetical protein SAMN04488062_10418 [Flavobacterium omnivorum]|uniref:Uncharacterized protein n=1 Tax=Flavobacterium omnivorum TaxID=178355 RepID=A0A1G7ZCJ2_9FLAO|nr:hypothetical protein [Flavobacterium omnivorum]SDH06473.1 hypothetical protein SAMN04488062_10418 [Flavobacterium omnivorum]
MNNNNFNDSLISTITKSKLPEVITDLAEVNIDNVFNNISFLKDIPILGVIVNLFSTTLSIRDYIFMSKIVSFLKPMDKISPEDREKMFLKLELNEEYNGKVGNKLLFILDKIDDLQKAKLIGVLFKNTLCGKLNYELFLRYASIIDKVFLSDLKRLPEYETPIGNQEISASLYGLGLIIRTGIFDNTENDIEQDIYKLSNLGKTLNELLEDEW